MWVFQELLKEREFTRREIELRCKEEIQECFKEMEKSTRNETINKVNNTLAAERMVSSVDWMHVFRKEMEKMRVEWLKEDRQRRILESEKQKKKEEEQKKNETRRVDNQLVLAKKLKEMGIRVCELEKSRERIENEREKEREEMEKNKKMIQAYMEKEMEKMRKNKEMFQLEVRKEKEEMEEYRKLLLEYMEKEMEEMRKYKEMIHWERQKEKEEIKEKMEKLKESQRALDRELSLIKEETKKFGEEWTKEKKRMAQYIKEEEAEKPELKREMRWMITERNQEKQQVQANQQREELSGIEMEELGRELNGKLKADKEPLENTREKEIKWQKLRIKQMISENQQEGWNPAGLEVQIQDVRKECVRNTREMVRNISVQYSKLENMLITFINHFADRLKEVEIRVEGMLEQDKRMTDKNMSGPTGTRRNVYRMFRRCLKK